MSDTETTGAEEQEAALTPEDMASRGVGRKVENLVVGKDDDAIKAVETFKETSERYKVAEAAFDAVKAERNAMVYELKAEHNISFTALAEITGTTSSLMLYLYERAQGKTAKQIREESQRSAAAKKLYQEADPNRKPVRKQSAQEKELRKRQREELKRFLEEEKARIAAEGGDTSEQDAGLAAAAAEDAEDDG